MTRVIFIAGGVIAVYLSVKILSKAGTSLFRKKNLVGFSSQLAAACRALETEKADALFKDPLAAVIAGEDGMTQRREGGELGAYTSDCKKADLEKYKKDPVVVTNIMPKSSDGSSLKPKPRFVDRIVLRTWYLDTTLEAILLGKATDPHFKTTMTEVKEQLKGASIKQVVVLGAGMDTRVWRLKGLPAGITWFELDTKDVVDIKKTVLKEAGCQFPDSKGSDFKYPLAVSKYTQVAYDLSDPTWSDALSQAGHVASQPTLWIAEGLLHYLPKSAVDFLLQKCRKMSVPGSVFWCNSVDERDFAVGTPNMVDDGSEHFGTQLYKTFQSGVPKNRDEYLKEHGWNAVNFVSYVDAGLWISKGVMLEHYTVPQDHNSGFLTCVAKP